MTSRDTAAGPQWDSPAWRMQTVLDPVCEMEIRPEQAVARATLDGWRHFDFCSRSCYEAFLDTPHAYVGWSVGKADPDAARHRHALLVALASSGRPR